MGIQSTIEEFLSQAFRLPVVFDVSQTNVENCISYRVADSDVQVHVDNITTHDASITVSMRAQNGYDSLGYLSQKLASMYPSSGINWRVAHYSSTESIDYISTTEIIISIQLVLQLKVYHDQIKETIEEITIG